MPHSFAEKRAALEELRKRNTACPTRRHHYRVDRIWTNIYFSDTRLYDWQAEVEGFARHVQSTGSPALFLDVCGNTNAIRMGFDHSFQASMSHEGTLIKKAATVYRTDIFAHPGLKPVAEDITQNHGQLTLTIFRPLAGLQAYMTLGKSDAYSTLVHHRLFRQLELVVNATRVGGYIHLERPFQMDESIGEFISKTPARKRLSHVTLKSWARTLHCSVRLHHDSFGPKWLLRKDYKCLGPIP
jgi:hypothetical protein